jgi:serine/threonine protein kinase
MEYCLNGSLDSYFVKNNNLLNEKQGVYYMLCVLNALEILHNNGIIHRDIKPANVLLNKMLSPQLADMGLCLKLETKEERRIEYYRSRAYMEPKVSNQF